MSPREGFPAAALVLAAIAPAAMVAFPPETVPAGRFLFALLAAAAVALVALRPAAGRRDGLLAAALLLPLAAAAVAAAPGRARALDEAALFASLLAFVLLGRLASRDPRASGILGAVLVALGSAAALLAVAQVLWFYPQGALALRAGGTPADAYSDAMLVRLEAGRPSGPFVLPAALAGFLALTLPATALVLLRGKGRGRVQLAAAAGTIQIAALVMTRSLGGLVAAACALALLLVPRAARPARAAAAVILVTILACAAFLYDRRAEIGSGPGRDPLSLRAGNWSAAMSMVRDHPLLGVGPGGFATAYTLYLRPGMNETRYAHNSWLQILACWGLWAAVPLAAGAGLVARSIGAASRDRSGTAALAAGGAAFLLHNLVDFTLYLPGVATAAAVATGLALGAGVPGAATAGVAGASSAGPSGTWGRRLAIGAGALTTCCLLLHGLASARAAAHLEAARRSADAGAWEAALAAARRAAAARPGDPDPRAFLAEVILERHEDDAVLMREGREAAAVAAGLDPRSAVRHATLAAYAAAAGEPAAARVELARAHRLFPARPEYRPPDASP